jgi:hypothetical protein
MAPKTWQLFRRCGPLLFLNCRTPVSSWTCNTAIASQIRRQPLAEDFFAPCTRYRLLCGIDQRVHAAYNVCARRPPAPCARHDAGMGGCVGGDGDDEDGRLLAHGQQWFPWEPGNPNARSDKMWCDAAVESDFEPHASHHVRDVTPQAYLARARKAWR